METKINPKIKGHLKITDEHGHILYDDHNAVVINAENLLRRMTVGQSPIDSVKAYALGVPLASTTIVSSSFTSTNAVTMTFQFLAGDFNDTMDKIILGNSVQGPFSEVTGLSIFKDNNTSLNVAWKLTFNI